MAKRMVLIFCAAILAAGTLYLGACAPEKPPSASPAEPGVAVGQSAPPFSLNDLQGKPVKIGSGQVTVINFWATWCPPCREELPDLQRFFDANGATLTFWAVNIQEPAESVEAFMQRNNYRLPVLLDTDGKVAGTYRVSAIPTTIVLDGQGIIRFRKTGAVTLDELAGVIRGL